MSESILSSLFCISDKYISGVHESGLFELESQTGRDSDVTENIELWHIRQKHTSREKNRQDSLSQ